MPGIVLKCFGKDSVLTPLAAASESQDKQHPKAGDTWGLNRDISALLCKSLGFRKGPSCSPLGKAGRFPLTTGPKENVSIRILQIMVSGSQSAWA